MKAGSSSDLLLVIRVQNMTIAQEADAVTSSRQS
jgi:hypothetical protein